VTYREEVAQTKRRAYRDEAYWGRPATGFGDHNARVLVVGLAPGAHGANRTGRMFTGDGSGDFLYASLYRAGFANQPTSRTVDDGLALQDMYISAVCRCAPPDNKPLPEEQAHCLPYLAQELALLPDVRVIVALGRIAFDGVLRLTGQGQSRKVAGSAAQPDGNASRPRPGDFGHGAVCRLGDDGLWLVASYHPSRQNTQTGRLTAEMFEGIWTRVRELLNGDRS
jgi:uracil-DNA glycosylase family 4